MSSEPSPYCRSSLFLPNSEKGGRSSNFCPCGQHLNLIYGRFVKVRPAHFPRKTYPKPHTGIEATTF